MHSHQIQILLLLLSLVLSIFLLIAAAKYAAWSRVMILGQPSGSWLYVPLPPFSRFKTDGFQWTCLLRWLNTTAVSLLQRSSPISFTLRRRASPTPSKRINESVSIEEANHHRAQTLSAGSLHHSDTNDHVARPGLTLYGMRARAYSSRDPRQCTKMVSSIQLPRLGQC
jgi:hypothetical protein